MKSIILIGGTFTNLITALELVDMYDIKIFELNAEIGLPSKSPGHLKNQTHLSKYLTPDQLEFLKLHQFDDGYTLRSEWGLKHLAVHAANNGVEIFTRTRITNCFETSEGFTIEYQGGGPESNGQLDCHHLVNDIQWTYQAPGAKQHMLPNSKNILVPQFGEFVEMHGGTALSKDCTNLPEDAYILPRSEGLTEVWQFEENWNPHHGWIETIQNTLPIQAEKRCIDAQIEQGWEISKLLK